VKKRHARDAAPLFLKRRDRAAVLVILLAAFCLRLWGLGAKSLWLDEIMTVENASRPFVEMIGHLRQFDAHPPLYQAIVWLWLRIGRGDGFARFPSVVAGCASVFLVYLIGRRLMGRRAALAAAALTALSSFQIYYSQEARLFSALCALFLAQFYVFLRILHQRGRARWGWWAAYGALVAATLFTYALSILTIGAFAALYLWFGRRRRRIQWPQLILVHLVVALLFYATWYPHLARRSETLKRNIAQRHDAAGRPGAGALLNGAAVWGFGPQRSATGLLIPILGAGILASAVFAAATRRAKRPAIMLGALFALPLAGYMILPMPRVQAYDPKHLIFLQPLLFLALAGSRRAPGVLSARRRLGPLAYALLAVIALNLFSLGGYYHPEREKENWRDLFAYVEERVTADDAFIFEPEYTGFAFSYYAGTPEAREGVRFLTERGMRIGPDVRRIWLMECRSPVARPHPERRERIEASGWAMRETRAYEGTVGHVEATLFDRNGEGSDP